MVPPPSQVLTNSNATGGSKQERTDSRSQIPRPDCSRVPFQTARKHLDIALINLPNARGAALLVPRV